MRSRLAGWTTIACVLLLPTTAAAAGAWQSYVRPASFADLLAEGDTVWCATREAGLLIYSSSRRTFSSYLREPNGLASNRLTSLALDHSQRLWMGTVGKGASVLSTHRGSWQLVNAFDGLPSDSVTALTAHGDSMWIGTTGGLALWNGLEIGGVLPDGVNPSPFLSDYITGIVETGDSLWIATQAGVYIGRLSQGLSSWTQVSAGLLSTRVDAMVSDGAVPFALAQFGAHRFDFGQGRWVLVGGIGAVRTLGGDHGAVLAGTGNGLFRWDGTGWTLLDDTLKSTSVSPFVLTADATGRVTAAGRPAGSVNARQTGIYLQPSGAGAWTFDFPPGPPGNDCLNVDTDGTKTYVATYDQGSARLDGDQWTYWFPTLYGDTSSTTLRRPLYPFGMLVDKPGRKWFFCWAPLHFTPTGCVPDTGTLDLLEDVGRDVVEHRLLGPPPPDARRSFVRASSLDSSGGHWFGLDSPCGDQVDLAAAGLEYYKPDASYGGNFNSSNLPANTLRSDQVWAVVTDRNRRVWVGTSRGISFFDRLVSDVPEMTFLENTDQYVVRGLAAYGDSLWALTTSEIRRYSASGEFFLGSYTVPAGPAFQAVRPLDVGPDGTLWLGTVNGVRAYHPGGSVEDFNTTNSPIADDEVRSLHVDRRTGVVWMATGGGLSRYDPHYVPPKPSQPSLSLVVYPNPARLTNVGTPIRLRGNGTGYRGEIYDLSGRIVHTFATPANGRIVWGGLDDNGDPVRPGIYFLRAESGGQSAVARFALIR